jgi:F-type H+-transporting ATPase subunit epsilon
VARTPFQVEVLTPEGEIFNDQVEMLSTMTGGGSIGILANHQPVLAMLEPAELRLYTSESEVVRFAQGEGYLQVTGERALVLVEEAHKPEDIDTGLQQERLRQAEERMTRCEEGSEEFRKAERDKRRAEAFLALAQGGSQS